MPDAWNWDHFWVTSLLNRTYETVAGLLPPEVAGRLDLFRPRVGQAWGGPLNGQERRRAIVRELARAVDFDVVIETGTYRGTSTEFFSAVFGVPVETVEGDPRLFGYSRRRLAFDPKITVHLGDSRTFLREVAQRRSGETAFFYLDAHWEEDLPLREELEIIRDSWRAAVVLVDDFRVPGDPGYGYDDYGSGRALVEEYLPPLPGWSLRYPVAPSSAETGVRRGSCVLLSPTFTDLSLTELRPAV